MTPLEAQQRLAYRIAGMAMGAFLRGLKVESVQAFGFRDDIVIRGLDSPAILLRPDASYEMKAPVVMQRGMLEMAALMSLAKYLGVSDPYALNVDNLKNAKMLAGILEPGPHKAEGLLERLRAEAEELVHDNWAQITATAEAIVKQGRVESDALVDLLSYGKAQPFAPKPLPRETNGLDGMDANPNVNRVTYFV